VSDHDLHEIFGSVEEPEEDSFAYDLFLACVTGYIAAHYDPNDVYLNAKFAAQRIYDDAATDKNFDEVMNQTWPTTPS
jgi:hypothetical protein